MIADCETDDTFTVPGAGWPSEPRHFNSRPERAPRGRARVDRPRRADRAERQAGKVVLELWRAFDKAISDMDAVVRETAREPSPAPRGALAALDRVADLPKGWDTYGSPPVPDAAVHQARALLILVRMARCPDPTVSPVPGGGGVQLEWNRGDRGVEVYIDATGGVSYLRTDSDEVVEAGLSPTRVWIHVQKLVRWVNAA